MMPSGTTTGHQRGASPAILHSEEEQPLPRQPDLSEPDNEKDSTRQSRPVGVVPGTFSSDLVFQQEIGLESADTRIRDGHSPFLAASSEPSVRSATSAALCRMDSNTTGWTASEGEHTFRMSSARRVEKGSRWVKGIGWRGEKERKKMQQATLAGFMQSVVLQSQESQGHPGSSHGRSNSWRTVASTGAQSNSSLSQERPLTASLLDEYIQASSRTVVSRSQASGITPEHLSEADLVKQYLRVKQRSRGELAFGGSGSAVEACVQGMYLRSCLRAPCVQDEQLRLLRQRRSWFRPLLLAEDAASRSAFHAVLLLFAAMCVIWGAGLFRAQLWRVEARQVRFSAAEGPAGVLGGLAFSVRWQGCKVEGARSVWGEEEGATVVSLESRQPVSEFCAEPREEGAEEERAEERVRVRVEVRGGEEEEWSEVAAQAWGSGPFGEVIPLELAEVGGGVRRCHRLQPGTAETMGVSAAWAALHVAGVAMARGGWEEQANWVIVLGMVFGAFANFFSAVLAAMAGQAELITWLRGGILVAALLAVSQPREQIHRWGVLMGAALFAALVWERTVIHDKPETLARNGELWTALALLAAAVAAEVRGWRALRRARRELVEDAGRYEAEWGRQLEEEAGAGAAVEEVGRWCEEVAAERGGGAPRQRKEVMGLEGGRGGPGEGGWEEVQSLDQLHGQAAVVLPLFRERVQAWAGASRAWVQARGGGLVEWEEVAQGRRGAEEVAWCAKKGFERSKTKAVGAYACEVARLCDIARESLYFASVADVAACLRAVAEDPFVRVEYAKETLSAPAAAATAQSGGLRFVKVLVRVVGEESRGLGVEGHLCELLLRLRALEAVQDPPMRARYRTLRAARGAATAPFSPRSALRALRNALARAGGREGRGWAGKGGGGVWMELESREPSQERSRASSQEEGRGGAAQGQAAELEGGGEGAGEEGMRRECRAAMRRWVAEGNVGRLGELGERMQRVTEAVAGATSGSVFRMRRPLPAVLSKRRWQYAVLGFGVVALGVGIAQYRPLRQSYAARAVRFAALETRDGSLPRAPGVEAVAVQLNGCAVEGRQAARADGATTLVMEFAEEVEFNEMALTVRAEGPEGADVARFRVEAQGGSGEWEAVGASTEFRVARWEAALEEGRVEVPRERGAEVVVRMHSGEAGQMEGLGAVLVGAGMVAGGLAGWGRREQVGARVLKGAMLVAAVPPLLAAVLYAGDGRGREAGLAAAWGAGSAGWIGLVGWSERLLLEAFLWTGVVYCGATAAVHGIVYGGTRGWEAVDWFGAAHLGMYALCKLQAWANGRRVASMYARDCRLYAEVWAAVVADPEQAEVLEQLREVAAGLEGAGEPTQACVGWEAGLDDDEECNDGAWLAGCGVPHAREGFRYCAAVGSMDQLYAQAAVAGVVLRHKVAAWGRQCGGQVLVGGGEGGGEAKFVRLAELGRGGEERVRWGRVKAPLRALEKAHRCYGGKVGRLCDLARQSLVFAEAGEVLACLRLMQEDPDASILRVKNTLHPAAESSSGYRQVMVNLQIATEWTEQLGVATHVAEVQLLLKGFASAKTADGHRRYVEARNGRGE